LKKTFIALAAACAAGAAMAQSSVTLFGVVDVGIAHLTGTDVSRTGVSTGGANISRLGFRGTEDLGGGLAASFWLEAGLDVDSGAGKTIGSGGLSFNRRSTVSLSGVNWGELRLGRDDAATFLNTLIFDPFLTNGVGGNNAFIMQGAPIQVSNAISYFLPANLGGFYGQAQYTPSEQPSGAARQGKYWGVRAGWRNKQLNLAGATGELKGATTADNVKIHNAGVSYDFGIARPSLLWATEKKNGVKITALELGVVAPVGPGEIRAQFSRYDTSNSNADWRKLAIGYGYNLSKRTQLYGTVAHVSNGDGAQRSIGVQGLAAPGTTLGGNSNGYEAGIRHIF
jgi:predicted porin